MKRNVFCYTNDYENDTTIECVNTGRYVMLNCSYTSEDPDYGTETIHFRSYLTGNTTRAAYDLLGQISQFVDANESGRMSDVNEIIRRNYADYGMSTLIAVENALKEFTKDYKTTHWFMTIEEAAKMIGKEFMHGSHRLFNFCESCGDEMDECDPDRYQGDGWFGIRRIDGFFNNTPEEMIVAVGHWGGGDCAFGYVNWNETGTSMLYEEIKDAICKSICGDPFDIIFVELDTEEESK